MVSPAVPLIIIGIICVYLLALLFAWMKRREVLRESLRSRHSRSFRTDNSLIPRNLTAHTRQQATPGSSQSSDIWNISVPASARTKAGSELWSVNNTTKEVIDPRNRLVDRASIEAIVKSKISDAPDTDPSDSIEKDCPAAPVLQIAADADTSPSTDESIPDVIAPPMDEAVSALETAFSLLTREHTEQMALPASPPDPEMKEEPGFVPSETEPEDLSTANVPVAEKIPAEESVTAKDLISSTAPENRAIDESLLTPISEAPADETEPVMVISQANEEKPTADFLQFYSLNQQPFDVTPDPAYLYLSRVHREALASLSQGIENLRGFLVLIAKPGMGKTTLMNKVIEQWHDRARIVFLFQTQCNSTELLQYLLSELQVRYDATDIVAMHRALNDVLLQEMLQGKRFVLIVDEAQNLQDSVLETIRLLSDFETTHSKLIQIILSGQPQLVRTLMRPGLAQLRQRIAMVANLEPLGSTEVAEYIEHRLRTAGSSGKLVFSCDALMSIAERSEGIPRSINNLCFNALLLGHSLRQPIIDREVVEKVANKLNLELLA